jgi:Cu/Ag efflux pump CusA
MNIRWKSPLLALLLSSVSVEDGKSQAAGAGAFRDSGRARPLVIVKAEYPGAAPEEMERQVVVPLEHALKGTEGVRRLRAACFASGAVLWVEGDPGTESSKLRRLVSQRLTHVQAALPGQAVPELAPEAPAGGEILLLGLRAADREARADRQEKAIALRKLADSLRPRLLQLPFVADVLTTGGLRRNVVFSPQKLKAYSLSPLDVARALAKATDGKGKEAAPAGDIADLPLVEQAGKIVRVRDLADIEVEDPDDPTGGKAPKDVTPAVLLGVRPGANSEPAKLGAALDDLLERVRQGLPADVKLERKLPKDLARLAVRMARQIERELPPEAMLTVGESKSLGPSLRARARGELSVTVIVNDLDILSKALKDVRAALAGVPGVRDVQAWPPVEEVLQPQVEIQSEQARREGVQVADVNLAIQAYLGDNKKVVDSESLKKLFVRSVDGRMIPLGALVKIRKGTGSEAIYRQDGKRAAPVFIAVGGRTPADVLTGVRRALAPVELDLRRQSKEYRLEYRVVETAFPGGGGPKEP